MINKIFTAQDAQNTQVPKYGLPLNTKVDHVLKWDGLLEVIKTWERGSILDIGCGYHNFPILLHDLGFNVSCIEKDRISNEVRNHANIKSHIGDAFEYIESLPDNSLDYAVDGCSIIHFNPSSKYAANDGCRKIAELLKQKLKPNGKLLIVSDILLTTDINQYNTGEFLHVFSLIQSFHLGGLFTPYSPEIINNPYTYSYLDMILSVCRLEFVK